MRFERPASVRVLRRIGGFWSGPRPASSRKRGCALCETTTRSWASTGTGSPWTARYRRRLSEGKKTGPNPTDRAKGGTKRSLLTEAAGIPVGLAVDGANRVDFKLARETLDSIPIRRPRPTKHRPQGLCLDKGYDYAEIDALVDEFRFTGHVARRGQQQRKVKRTASNKARRWVVERTHSWMNRFRRILVRWEKRADTYIAMLHLSFALITWRASILMG